MADFGTVARPYARAVFDIANAAGTLSEWSDALAAAAAVVRDPRSQSFLGRPDLNAGDRARFVAGVCAELDGGRFLETSEGRGLLSLLDENERLGALPEIVAQFERLKAEAENKLKVTLVSAVEVGDDVATRVAHSLERRLGRQVELELEIDASLMGGAIIRAEDMVIDGSVRSRLQRMAESLID